MKTRGAHSFRPRVRRHSPPGAPTVGGPRTASVAVPFGAPDPAVASPSVAPTPAAAAATSLAPASTQGSAAPVAGVGSSSMAPARRRYHTRVGPTPHDLSYPNAQEGPNLRPRGVIHLETTSATLTTLLGHYWSPGPIPCIHYQAALLPLQPHPGKC